ncbi:MAG: virulence protein RhuM/Fic/DOC family protein, partial [bacterium]|nr:virulence protein RhuM/Fic/DOC family protein [bacterium]
EHETLWANRMQMADVFGVNPQAISKHVQNIYKENELDRKATSSKMELVQNESGRQVRREIDMYNLEVLIAVGYRINSVVGTKFRQWATKTLRQHITKGYTLNPKVIKHHYVEFQKAIENIKQLLPAGTPIDHASVLELISAFADTWLSLDAYDRDALANKGATKKSVALTAEQLSKALLDFKISLMKKGEATDLFGYERNAGNVDGIVGNVMQSFGGKSVYPSVEEKAAHLLYFMVKNHPFTDGNKRNGAYAFIWYLHGAGILDRSKMTSSALTALTLFIAESDPKNKERMIQLVLQLLKK